MVVNRMSPKAALRREVAGMFRRAILDAAERVFCSRGFTEAKMTERAKDAGLAAGTLYNYFENKEEIFRALVDERRTEIVSVLESLAAEPGDPEEVLVRLVRGAFGYLERHRAMLGLVLQSGPGAEGALRRICGPSAERGDARYLAVFTGVLRRAIDDGRVQRKHDAKDLALLLTGAAHGLMRAWMTGIHPGRLAPRAEYVVRTFLEGVGTRR